MNSKEMRLSGESDDQPSSAEDSPASLIVLRENVKRLVMNVTLQENLKESFGRLNPDGSLLRMSQGYAQANLDGFLESSCMTFPRWGMLSDGVVGELPMSEPAIEENVSLSLPTLMANNLECEGKEYNGTRHAMKLHQAINLIPTARANERGNYQRDRGIKGKERLTLTGRISTIPTCTQRDYKDTGNLENVPEKSLLPRVLGKSYGLKLQPAFAEWMMGFPQGWTALSASEMPSSRSKSTRSSKRLQTLKTVKKED